MKQFRVMDELAEIPGHGVILFVEEGGADFADGCVIRDVRGNRHTVASTHEEDGLIWLELPQADAEYLGRLLRDIRVDATLFELEE